MISESIEGNVLRLAKVAFVHPESHMVDIVYMDDGSQVPAVSVLSPTAGTNCGRFDLPFPTPAADPWDPMLTHDRDLIAVIAMISARPYVIGFIYPPVSQMLFTEPNLRVDRHASDLYWTVRDNADIALHHPGGSSITMRRPGPDFTPAEASYCGNWQISKNTDAEVEVVADINNGRTYIKISKEGDVTITTEKSIAIESRVSDISLRAGGNISITAAGDVDIKGATVNLN